MRISIPGGEHGYKTRQEPSLPSFQTIHRPGLNNTTKFYSTLIRSMVEAKQKYVARVTMRELTWKEVPGTRYGFVPGDLLTQGYTPESG